MLFLLNWSVPLLYYYLCFVELWVHIEMLLSFMCCFCSSCLASPFGHVGAQCDTVHSFNLAAEYRDKVPHHVVCAMWFYFVHFGLSFPLVHSQSVHIVLLIIDQSPQAQQDHYLHNTNFPLSHANRCVLYYIILYLSWI